MFLVACGQAGMDVRMARMKLMIKGRRRATWDWLLLVWLAIFPSFGISGCAALLNLESTCEEPVRDLDREEVWDDEEEVFASACVLADPYEGVNRRIFVFNDKLYFWFLKPVATLYGTAVPEDFRIAARSALDNILFPVRFGNNLLQFKPISAGVELSRFALNSTLGLGGLTDPAKDLFNLVPQDEDMGQTLGVFGMNDGIYLCLPILGPSSFRDTLGYFGDYLFNPAFYVTVGNFAAGSGYYLFDRVNRTSLMLGEYEKFTAESFDPYIAMRNAYFQNRLSKLRDSVRVP